MVKLNLTGLQTAENTDTPVWAQAPVSSESIQSVTQETTVTPEVAPETNFSFSLSSLIWNPIDSNIKQEPQTTQETIAVISETPVIIETPAPQVFQEPKSESLFSIGWSDESVVNNSEEIISINNTTEEWNVQTTDEVVAEEVVAPVEEENKEFFKSFDVIKEFSEDKDEIIIGKWEAKVEEKSEDLASVSIMTEQNQEIIEDSKNVAEDVVANIEAQIQVSADIVIPAPVEAASILTNTNEESIVGAQSQGESLLLWDSVVTEEVKTAEAWEQTDIEQAKIDLSASRKPSGIKSFNKKTIFASLWAVFVLWIVAFGLNQMNMLGGKSNIQEINNIEPVKYVAWTDYTVIKNKVKNVKKANIDTVVTNSWSETGTWDSVNVVPQTPLDNSWAITDTWTVTASWDTVEPTNAVTSDTWVVTASWATDNNIIPQEPVGNNSPSARMNNEWWIPMTPPSWDWPANDMNDIANWVN